MQFGRWRWRCFWALVRCAGGIHGSGAGGQATWRAGEGAA